ncbi:RiPP maturation radical SAM C-methyltransferase [Longimicrobium sp.]|uniref:RiPP maturation radical SAM C-methyltransferase n=1 Tax=Longimicrobium sp. TaxID=2029185 RepID=UPI002BFA9EE7|nr:RiPP maturation radical SAM C-methyltransferase [Longimicrobium sp.]HSU13027.1 RiPP maturation radical SAM C-methyltransferase [Longimicrobium sp.]
MYKIALVNMPLATLSMPSLALTQLQSVVRQTFGARVEAQVRYLNHDFALYLGLAAYEELVSFEHHPTGLGEWFFREAAFPEAPDNADEYFQRYYPQHTARNRALKDFVMRMRAGLRTHFQEMIDRYGLDQADLVGFTSMFSQNAATLAMARMIRERNPSAVIVVGGANCEAPMGRELLENAPVLDFVFSGPSLRSFPRLLRCLVDGDTEGCHRIDGVFSRKNRVRDAAGCAAPGLDLAATGGPPEVRAFGEENDVNELAEYDWEEFLERYAAAFPERDKPILLFETSRGCWWGEKAHCTFCGLNGSTISYRSMRPENAFRVFNGLFAHADRVREFQSVDNILPKSYLTDVLPYLDTPPGVFMFYEVKADLTEDDFRTLARARVLRIQPGIEALNTSTLKLMRKGTSVFQNLSFLINAVRYGIEPAWNLLIGFPGEELEVYEKYERELPLLTHLYPPAGVFPVRFDRFSPYYEEAEAYGLDLHPLDWYELTYPFPRESLYRLAYYFADDNSLAPYATNAALMVARLRAKVDRWKTLWNSAGRPELRLCLREGVPHVFDSRDGVPLEYPLREESRRVLEALGTAKKVVNLARELEGVDVEAEIAWLVERGLVFHEGERYMSLLVAPPRPITVPLENVILATATV